MKTGVEPCPLCGGRKTNGTMTYTVDLKETLVVIRDVPATLCSLCGNEWLSDEIASQLELIVQDAKSKSRLVEITRFSKVA